MIIQTLEDKRKQTIIFISQVQKINKEAEVYSKVGRLFIKAQKKQVVEGLNKRIAMSWKQLICLQKDKISLIISKLTMTDPRANETCNTILSSLRKSGLNFIAQETPYSAYVTIRKKFCNGFVVNSS